MTRMNWDRVERERRRSPRSNTPNSPAARKVRNRGSGTSDFSPWLSHYEPPPYDAPPPTRRFDEVIGEMVEDSWKYLKRRVALMRGHVPPKTGYQRLAEVEDEIRKAAEDGDNNPRKK